MNDRSEESLARKIYLELLSRENLEVIDGPRTTTLVEKALQFAAAFREGKRSHGSLGATQGANDAQDPKRGRRLQEAFAVRQEPRRAQNRDATPAGGSLHRRVPLAELKAANEPRQASQPALKPIHPQPLE
jgi:hypothetical protein